MANSMTSVPTADGGQLPAHLWLPESGSGPGLVLLQEIFGVSDYIRRRAQDLADLGYVVLAPEIYWRSGDVGPFGWETIERAMTKVTELDWGQAVLDGAAAVEQLRGNDAVTGGTGVIGFCFGGGLGFAVAAHLEGADGGGRSVDALVSFYGSALAGLVDTATVVAPSLHHFGLADQYIAADLVRRIESVLTQQPATTFCTYPGADHAFDNSDGPLHHPEASAQAWGRTVEWLREHLPVHSPA
ncbi:MAG: dienelactone hydrolase family protein [Propionibacteriaceae bacterium]|nr:dienelactone hydrolase family protein [Propionibacteriaceae bacterium]